MEYYYDIDLCFFDNYIPYEKWEDITHLKKVPVLKIKNVDKLIKYNAIIDTPYHYIIFTDGNNCVATEIINNNVAFLSSLSDFDRDNILDMAKSLKLSKISIIYASLRFIFNTDIT